MSQMGRLHGQVVPEQKVAQALRRDHFGLAFFVVFLIKAAQYESWTYRSAYYWEFRLPFRRLRDTSSQPTTMCMPRLACHAD
jgi:hypothetical protein